MTRARAAPVLTVTLHDLIGFSPLFGRQADYRVSRAEQIIDHFVGLQLRFLMASGRTCASSNWPLAVAASICL